MDAFLTKNDSDLCGQVTSNECLGAERIKVITLDTFCKDHNLHTIDLLKIDVEGNEINVLKGATSMISKNSVKAILVECDFNKEDKQHTYFFEIFSFLNSRN